jgi:hypothetical protein
MGMINVSVDVRCGREEKGILGHENGKRCQGVLSCSLWMMGLFLFQE